MCGWVAKRLKKSHINVGTIVGLDPAKPGFSYDDVQHRLDKSDADYVLILHTDVNTYGMIEPIGHGL